MKRTDEMKLGEGLRGYCDCNQGRLPCTCGRRADRFGGYSAINPPPPMRVGDKTDSPIQRFSVPAQLQLMKALAILGWAAYFLELLRV